MKSYKEANHPYHQTLIKEFQKVLGSSWKPQVLGTDSCGLPAPSFFLHELGVLFSYLVNSKKKDWIWSSMTTHPDLVGGTNRLDTDIMKQCKGKVLAKEGADGLLGLSVVHKKYPKGLGVVIKLAQGRNDRDMTFIAHDILNSLGFSITGLPLSHGKSLHISPSCKPHSKETSFWDISPEISSQTAVYPGDTPFERTIHKNLQKGDSYTLSSIKTTVHIGAHTDAPNHYHKEGKDISHRPLQIYMGPCQVIEVKKQPKERIKPQDLKNTPIKTTRILFKTKSFPNPNKWTDDFNSLSPELIEFLHKKNVKLVGIDTPSVDPSNSKKLESHQKIYEKDMAILEGVVLSHVKPGDYKLIALPLKLKGADASPVRALLLK